MAAKPSAGNTMGETDDEKHDEPSPVMSEQVSEDGRSDDSQPGVRRIEAISQTWSKPALFIAYMR